MGLAALSVLSALVALSVAAAAGVGSLLAGRRRGATAAVLVAVMGILGAGVAGAATSDGALLRVRWAASRQSFETEVLAAGAPVPLKASDDSSFVDHYPGGCPGSIGKFHIVECRAIDKGYLFLQAENALTDDSGIVYLPDGREGSDWGTETLTPLGGPWWSWTCYC
jgi:hypothetical protein